MFTRPNLIIARLDNACQNCRLRRRKCDLATPACSSCQRLKIPCITGSSKTDFIGDELRYHVFLENRVAELERRLGTRAISDSSGKNGASQVSTDFSLDRMAADIGALSLRASSLQTFLDRSGEVSFTQLVLVTAGCIYSKSTAFHDDDWRRVLPDRSTADRFLQHYSSTIWKLLPLFPLSSFIRQVQAVYSQDSPSKYDLFTVFIILAISSASLTHSRGSIGVQCSLRFFQQAIIQVKGIPLQTLSGLQATLLLAQYSMLNPAAIESWYLLGIGMRTCMELGLHKEPPHASKADAATLENRKRLFWSAYLLDRLYSISMGLTFDIAENSIDVAFPLSEGLSFGLFLQIRRLQAKSFLATTVDEFNIGDIRQELMAWSKSLSESDVEQKNRDIMNLDFYYSIILLLRPCRMNPNRSTTELFDLFEACRSFIMLLRRIDSSFLSFYPHLTALQVYYSGLALLVSSWNCQNDHIRFQQALSSSINFVIFLTTVQTRWENGLGLANQLENVLDAFIRHYSDPSITCPVQILDYPLSLPQSVPTSNSNPEVGFDALLQDLFV